MIKNLFITEHLCKPTIIVIVRNGEDYEGSDTDKLASLGMVNGKVSNLTVRFVRAQAFLTRTEIDSIIVGVEEKTQSKYPRELTMQALNMAPKCTFDQTLSNLVNHPVRVFEAILRAECRQILKEVKAIREQPIFPTCRIRYQILGE